jgi:hypothetical protein
MRSCTLLGLTALACSTSALFAGAASALPPMAAPMPASAPMGMMSPNPAVFRAGPGPLRPFPPAFARGIGPMGGPILARAGIGRFGGPGMLARGMGPLQAWPAVRPVAFNGPPAMGWPGGAGGPAPFAFGGPPGPWSNPYALGIGPFRGPGIGAPPVGRAAFGGPGSPPMAIPGAGYMGGFGPNMAMMAASYRPGLGGFGGLPPVLMTQVAWQPPGPAAGMMPWPMPPMMAAPGAMGPAPPTGMPYQMGWSSPMVGPWGGPSGPWAAAGPGGMSAPYPQWVAARQMMAMGPAAFRPASYGGPAGSPNMFAAGLGPMGGAPMLAGAPPRWLPFGSPGAPMMGGPGMGGAGNGPVNPIILAGFGPQVPAPSFWGFGPSSGPMNPMMAANFTPRGPWAMSPGSPTAIPVSWQRGIGPFGLAHPAIAARNPMSGPWGPVPGNLYRAAFRPGIG